MKSASRSRTINRSSLAGCCKRSQGNAVADATGNKHDGQVRRGLAPVRSHFGATARRIRAARYRRRVDRRVTVDLRLKIPAGKEPLKFTVWLPSDSANASAADSDSRSPICRFQMPIAI